MSNLILGKVSGLNQYLEISSEAINHSVLIVGSSGSGKTYALQEMERNIARQGGIGLVLDYHGTHEMVQESEIFHRIDVYDEGMPFPLSSACRRPDGSFEDMEDVIEAMIDIFGNVERLTSKQRAALRKSFLAALSDVRRIDFCCVLNHLRLQTTDAAQAVAEKFYPIFSKLIIKPRLDLLKRGTITILDMGKFSFSAQRIMSELVLSTLWRYFRLNGQSMEIPLFVVADEFQTLNLKADSIISQVLREGRKFHLALLLATQTLESFNKGQISVIMQAATHLYFRPIPSEARRVARYMETDHLSEMEKRLRELKRGECIATGSFRIGNLEHEKPVKIHF